MARDQQRQRVYKAENSCGCFSEGVFDTLKGLEDWLNGILEDKRFQKRYPMITGIKINGGNGRQRRAYGGPRTGGICYVSFPKGMRTQLIGLHELAHGIAKHVHGYDTAGHGPEWCQEYVWLTKTFISVEKSRQLAQAFRDKGVTRTTRQYRDAARERLTGVTEITEETTIKKPIVVSGTKRWIIKFKQEDNE